MAEAQGERAPTRLIARLAVARRGHAVAHILDRSALQLSPFAAAMTRLIAVWGVRRRRCFGQAADGGTVSSAGRLAGVWRCGQRSGECPVALAWSCSDPRTAPRPARSGC